MSLEKAHGIRFEWDRWDLLRWGTSKHELQHYSVRDSPPSIAVAAVKYVPRASCDNVITPKHAVIIWFFLVMAYSLFRFVQPRSARNCPIVEGTNLSVRAT